MVKQHMEMKETVDRMNKMAMEKQENKQQSAAGGDM
jgi:hypothetical protein